MFFFFRGLFIGRLQVTCAHLQIRLKCNLKSCLFSQVDFQIEMTLSMCGKLTDSRTGHPEFLSSLSHLQHQDGTMSPCKRATSVNVRLGEFKVRNVLFLPQITKDLNQGFIVVVFCRFRLF